MTRLSDDGVERIKVSLDGFEQKFCFAVAEGDKDLLALLNEGLAIVSENGTYEKLYLKWFPFLVDTTPDYNLIIRYFLGALLAIFIALLLFSFLIIRKEVKRQTAALQNNDFRNSIMFNVMKQDYRSVMDRLDYVLNELIEMTGSEFGYIYLYDEASQQLSLNSWSKGVMKACQVAARKSLYHLDSVGIWGEVIRQRQAMIINDFSQVNPLKKGTPPGHVKIDKWMGIPVFSDNQIVATVGLANRPVDYDDNDLHQVTALMSGVWTMIEKSNYRDKLEIEKNKYLSTLVSIGDGVLVVDLDGRIEIINQVATDLTGWTEAQAQGMPYQELLRLSHEDPHCEIIDPIRAVLQSGQTYELGNHAVLTAKNGQSYLLEDSAAPVRNSQKEMIGVVLVFRDVTQKRAQSRQIEYLSFHDALTGLYNRRFFEAELQRLDTPRNYPLTIIMADLNGLKLTNDAFGHHQGDILLKETANLFKSHLRADDIAARWGGDEFVILMPKTSSTQAQIIVDRMNHAASQIEASSGILSIAFGWDSKTDPAMDLGAVFKNAEEYMYKRKILENQGVRGLTIKTIMNTLYEKSPREESHSQRVKELAVKIAKALQLSPHQIDDIATLGLLHDIGKIIVPGQILEKPQRLTPAEYDEIKKHPAIGYRMLTATNEFASIAQGVLSHHERWDGSGYPNGIKGHEIPLESRIIAIADAYDAMTASRPYRKNGLSFEKARQVLIDCAGSQFDPDIVAVLINEQVI